jgi:hypothetical protein
MDMDILLNDFAIRSFRDTARWRLHLSENGVSRPRAAYDVVRARGLLLEQERIPHDYCVGQLGIAVS